MGGLAYLTGTIIFVPLFIYCVKRKIALSNRWADSIGTALRDWSLDAARDAKAAVDEELIWTFALIILMAPTAIFPVSLFLWLLGAPNV